MDSGLLEQPAASGRAGQDVKPARFCACGAKTHVRDPVVVPALIIRIGRRPARRCSDQALVDQGPRQCPARR